MEIAVGRRARRVTGDVASQTRARGTTVDVACRSSHDAVSRPDASVLADRFAQINIGEPWLPRVDLPLEPGLRRQVWLRHLRTAIPTGGDQPRGVGEWLFSVAAFGDNAPDPGDGFLRTASDLSAEHTAALRDLRQGGIDQYLDELICSIDWAHYRVIGFTNTFAQTVPSLALAARIKTHHPEAIIVFGGANLDGPMGRELVRSMSMVDYGISGEADLAITDLLVALSEGADPAGSPGYCADAMVS